MIKLPLLVENLIKWYLTESTKLKALKRMYDLRSMSYDYQILLDRSIVWQSINLNMKNSLYEILLVLESMTNDYYGKIKEGKISYENYYSQINYFLTNVKKAKTNKCKLK